MDVEQLLERWRAAELLDDFQVEEILAFERDQDTAHDHGRAVASGAVERRGLIAEAVGYIGTALVLAGLWMFLDEWWEQLRVGGRITLIALLTVLLLGSGQALRSSSSPAMQRLVNVLWAAGVFGVGAVLWLVADDAVQWSESALRALVINGATAVVAWRVYVMRRAALLQFVLLIWVLVTVGHVLAELDVTEGWVGLVIWSVGVVWVLLGVGGWLTPRWTAELLGAIVLLFGAQLATFSDATVAAQLLALASSGALIWSGVVGGRTHHLAVGAIGLFVFSIQLVFELFSDVFAPGVLMLLIGLLLVLLAVGLGRALQQIRVTAKR